MAEAVRQQLETQVEELHDLRKRGIFSQGEVRQIVRRRRAFEYALRRRTTRKGDLLGYIQYELRVEALRRKRKVLLRMHKKNTPSEYSIVRRIHFLFQRALQKFKGDPALWAGYFDFCQRTGANRLLGRAYARAIQYHPLREEMWIAAAKWEFECNSNMRAARVLMQRALRVLPESPVLWTEYLRLELLYWEKMRLRARLLGVELKDETSEAQRQAIAEGEALALQEAEAVRRQQIEEAEAGGYYHSVVYNDALPGGDRSDSATSSSEDEEEEGEGDGFVAAATAGPGGSLSVNVPRLPQEKKSAETEAGAGARAGKGGGGVVAEQGDEFMAGRIPILVCRQGMSALESSDPDAAERFLNVLRLFPGTQAIRAALFETLPATPAGLSLHAREPLVNIGPEEEMEMAAAQVKAANTITTSSPYHHQQQQKVVELVKLCSERYAVALRQNPSVDLAARGAVFLLEQARRLCGDNDQLALAHPDATMAQARGIVLVANLAVGHCQRAEAAGLASDELREAWIDALRLNLSATVTTADTAAAADAAAATAAEKVSTVADSIAADSSNPRVWRARLACLADTGANAVVMDQAYARALSHCQLVGSAPKDAADIEELWDARIDYAMARCDADAQTAREVVFAEALAAACAPASAGTPASMLASRESRIQALALRSIRAAAVATSAGGGGVGGGVGGSGGTYVRGFKNSTSTSTGGGNGVRGVRRAVERLRAQLIPLGPDVILAVVGAETCRLPVDTTRVVQLFESALSSDGAYAATSVELWLAYCRFAAQHQDGGRARDLYWRAVGALDRTQEFVARHKSQVLGHAHC